MPPPTLASPIDLGHPPGTTPRWYLPGWSERFRLMGWRIVLFVPGAAMLLLLALLPIWPWAWQLLIAWWQLWVMVVALPLGAGAWAAGRGLRLRKDPFCIHCGYSLQGLPDGHNCPECGSRFFHAVIDEYRRDPHWFIERYKLRHDLPPTPDAWPAGPTERKSRDGT